jgi:hypothetical protein
MLQFAEIFVVQKNPAWRCTVCKNCADSKAVPTDAEKEDANFDDVCTDDYDQACVTIKGEPLKKEYEEKQGKNDCKDDGGFALCLFARKETQWYPAKLTTFVQGLDEGFQNDDILDKPEYKPCQVKQLDSTVDLWLYCVYNALVPEVTASRYEQFEKLKRDVRTALMEGEGNSSAYAKLLAEGDDSSDISALSTLTWGEVQSSYTFRGWADAMDKVSTNVKKREDPKLDKVVESLKAETGQGRAYHDGQGDEEEDKLEADGRKIIHDPGKVKKGYGHVGDKAMDYYGDYDDDVEDKDEKPASEKSSKAIHNSNTNTNKRANGKVTAEERLKVKVLEHDSHYYYYYYEGGAGGTGGLHYHYSNGFPDLSSVEQTPLDAVYEQVDAALNNQYGVEQAVDAAYAAKDAAKDPYSAAKKLLGDEGSPGANNFALPSTGPVQDAITLLTDVFGGLMDLAENPEGKAAMQGTWRLGLREQLLGKVVEGGERTQGRIDHTDLALTRKQYNGLQDVCTSIASIVSESLIEL